MVETKVSSLYKLTTTECNLFFIQPLEIQVNLKGKVNRSSLCATGVGYPRGTMPHHPWQILNGLEPQIYLLKMFLKMYFLY